MFEREDWQQFRNLHTLSQKAGVSQSQLASLAAKELTDNALDAVENQDNGRVNVGTIAGGFFVQDNGDGINPADLPRLFSIRRPLMSSKLLRKPSRGALGNGLRVVSGLVLATGGKLTVSTRGQVWALSPQENGETTADLIGACDIQGVRVEVELPADLINRQTLNWASRAVLLNRGKSYTGKTSPFWYDTDTFYELAQAANGRSVRDLIAEFDGCSGAKAGRIADGFQGREAATLSRAEAEALLEKSRAIAKPVKATRLGKIGNTFTDDCEAAYGKSITGVLELDAARGTLGAEIPFIVEAWAVPSAYDEPEFLVSVNKTPITGHIWARKDRHDLTLAAAGLAVGYVKVGRSNFDVWLNIQTPYMPIKSDGKLPDLTLFTNAIQDAAESAVNKAKRDRTYTSTVATASQKDIVFNHLEDAVIQVSDGGRYRFSQRQLFYNLRPLLMQVKSDPSYDTFSGYITEYEALNGDIPGLYRDARGAVYVPHISVEIPLGTLEVETYRHRAWTFNKVLYSEKEGFFSILKTEGWPERNDCLLLSSKGQAGRAAKDLIDLLGETDEPLLFFCIHDADAAGTMIYQSLTGATKSRPGRKVEIINLGLDPWEARDMNLEVENPKYKKYQPTADYIDSHWANWLQTNRVELNAMTTPQFLEWLDQKIADHDTGKLNPPAPVSAEHLNEITAEKAREVIRDRVLKEAGFEGQVSAALDKLKDTIENTATALPDRIDRDLSNRPADSWRDVVSRVADELADAA